MESSIIFICATIDKLRLIHWTFFMELVDCTAITLKKKLESFFFTSWRAFSRSLSISPCIDVKKAGMIFTSFSNSCNEFALSWSSLACLLCCWAALSATIFSSFSSLSAASSIWIFLSSSKHWFSSSSNSFLKTPKLIWSPGTQTFK